MGCRPGGICQDDKSSGLGRLLGEGIVEDKAVHATLAQGNIMCADRDLVRLAFPNPLDRYEALVREEVLGIAVFLGKPAGALGLGELGRIELDGSGGGDEVRCPAARVLHDTKIAAGWGQRMCYFAELGLVATMLTWTSCAAGHSRRGCRLRQPGPIGQCTTAGEC